MLVIGEEGILIYIGTRLILFESAIANYFAIDNDVVGDDLKVGHLYYILIFGR